MQAFCDGAPVPTVRRRASGRADACFARISSARSPRARSALRRRRTDHQSVVFPPSAQPGRDRFIAVVGQSIEAAEGPPSLEEQLDLPAESIEIEAELGRAFGTVVNRTTYEASSRSRSVTFEPCSRTNLAHVLRLRHRQAYRDDPGLRPALAPWVQRWPTSTDVAPATTSSSMPELANRAGRPLPFAEPAGGRWPAYDRSHVPHSRWARSPPRRADRPTTRHPRRRQRSKGLAQLAIVGLECVHFHEPIAF